MAKITLSGNEIETIGELPAIGVVAPNFKLVKSNLEEIELVNYRGKRVILNIFPSIDTPVCASSVRHFNQDVANLENTAVFCISADLPFAGARFCGAEGIEKVETCSVFRNPDFGKDYGVEITTGPLRGILSRAIVVLDEEGKVIYTEQVPEIGIEPNYELALNSLK